MKNVAPDRRTAAAAAVSLLVPLLVLVGPSGSAAAEEFPQPAPGTTWFGGELDWTEDDAASYTERLGSSVSLLSRPINYPLDAEATSALSDLAAQSVKQGAITVISLQPTAPLPDLDQQDADDLVASLNGLTADLGSAFLVRFAPEMNGTWVSYGQQPTAYVKAFTDVADALHDDAAAAQTVWSPAYGAGYPFGGSINAPVRGAAVDDAISLEDRRRLDTDSNGRLDASDDPYGPYFPGNEAVDWVGLSMLRYGVNQRFGQNTVPDATELQGRLQETFGYPDGAARASFYQRYAASRDKPMLLLTGALFNPAAASQQGPTERQVKGAWLRRVLAAAKSRPQLKAVVWLESNRVEPEVGGPVRWGLTSSPALGRALGRVVEAGAFDLGPAIEPVVADAEGADESPEGQQTEPEEEGDSGTSAVDRVSDATGLTSIQLSLLVMLLLLAVTAALFLRLRRQRMRPPWL